MSSNPPAQSAFSMENIDPQLRSANPVNAFLEESQRRFKTRLQQPSLTTGNSDNAGADAAMPNSMGPAIVLPVGLWTPAELTATSGRIKRKADFSDRVEVDFDNFCAASAEERQLLLMAITLQNQDLLQSMQNAGSSWELSGSLRKNIWQYAKAFLLSSTAICYVGDSAYQVIIKLSTKDSEEGLAIRNIACLAKKMIGQQNSVLQTRQLYIRLSIARYVYEISMQAPDKFWAMVDNMLHDMQKDGEELFVFHLNAIYTMDQERFGNPAQSGIKTVELGVAKLPSWVCRINELAPRVSRAQGEGERPAKCQHPADDGDSDGEEEDAEQQPGEPGSNDT
ncbi:hypothetical protein EDD85DRAFT_988073 [Armillaria nabsnona]|nr:hypothetical protein EDD85DRAFT_988073 [Armillaria nabsnona]